MASGKNVADLKRTLLKPALTSHFEIAMDSPFKAGGTQGGQSLSLIHISEPTRP